MHRPSFFGRFWRPTARTTSFGAFFALFFLPGAIFAAATSVELSPLIMKSTLLGPVDGNREVGVTLALPSSDPHGLADFVQHVSAPGDSLFRHYITPQQFAERFGGNASDYAYLKNWAAANGLRVSHESAGRINLTVRGAVAQFQKLFNTQLENFRSPDGQEFYSASVKPTIPAEIASKISGVIGLTESRLVTPMFKVAKKLGKNADSEPISPTDTAGGTGPGGTFRASDLRTCYNIPTFGNLNPDAVAAVFEQGGYNQSDLAKYFTYNKLPQVPVTPVSVDGSPTDVQDNNVELEAVLDVDMIVGMNPAISGVRVYIDSFYWDSFQTAVLDAMTQVGDDDLAQVFSISYGQDEGYQGTSAMEAENTALAQLAAEGITVTASAGDNGAYGDGATYPYNVSDPASQPYVTAVGGTTLRTGSKQDWLNEIVWNELGLGHGATGGGVSSYWPLPSYQNTPQDGTFYVTENGGSATNRNVPDISAVGDPLTGVGIYSGINGGWVQVGGTSVGSPIWAGYLTIIDAGLQYAGMGNLGYFNPILYWVGLPFDILNFNYLYNITQGSNGDVSLYPGYPGYSNNPGYSNTTGAGSVFGTIIGTQLLLYGGQPGNKPGATNGFTYSNLTYNSATFVWRPVTGASAYALEVFRNGASGYVVTQLYLTKDTTATASNLVPNNATYYALLWAYNASGYSEGGPVYFTTPKKPKN
jgi:subtilase family serine protease